jgi:fibronectin-binding autotransporter adhesin
VLSVEQASFITNNGTVTLAGSGGTGTNRGAALLGQLNANLLTNGVTGLITTTGQFNDGMAANGSGNTLVNNGSITTANGNSYGMTAAWGQNNTGQLGNTLINTGTVTTNGPSARGLSILGGNGTINNSGTVLTTGTGATGAYFQGNAGLLTNSGTIHVSGSGSIGVDSNTVSSTFTATIQNLSGGQIISDDGPGIRTLNGNTTLVNAGLIQSNVNTAIAMGNGDDSLILQTGSTIVGTANGGSGANSVTLQGTGTAANAFTNFQTLTMQGSLWNWAGTGTFTNALVQSGTLNVTGSLGASTVATVNPGATLEAAAANMPQAITDNGTVLFNQTVNGTYAPAISGSGNVTKIGAGALTLTGSSTYSGGTAVNGGTVQVSSDANLGASTGGVSIDGGTLRNTAGFTTARNVTLGSGGGTFDTATPDPKNTSQFLTVNGQISGAGSLTKTGTGTLILNGNNRYAGATTVTAGSLFVNGDQSLATGPTTVASGAQLSGNGTIGGNVVLASGSVFGPAAEPLTPATLTINGSFTANSGSTLLYNLVQANTAGGALNDLTVVHGDLTLNGATFNVLDQQQTFGPGVYRIINYDGTLLNNNLLLGSVTDGNLNPVAPLTGFSVQTAIPGQVNLVNTSGLSLTFWDGDASANKDNHQIDGTVGTWRNSGMSATSNWTDLTGGTNANWTDEGFAIFSGAPATVTVNSDNGAVRANGMQFAVDGYAISGDPLTLVNTTGTPAASQINVGDGSSASAGMTATIHSNITGNVLAKTDLGTLILTGNNTFGDPTSGVSLEIINGTVQVSQDANLGAAGDLVGIANGSTLHTTATFSTDRSIGIGTPGGGTNGGTIETDAGTALTVNGPIVENPANAVLTKAGGGTLVLTSNDNSYTGSTIISAGTLQLGAGGMTGSILGDVTNDGTLAFNRSNTLTFAGAISGSGTVLQQGSGTTVLTADNTYTGDTAIAAGTLQLGNGGTTGSILGNVTDNGTLAFNRSDTLTFAGTISGAGTVAQQGTGTTVLTADNTYTGGTTITAGTLQLGAGGTTGSLLGNVTDNSTLAFNRSNTLTVSGTVSGAGNIVQLGPGTTVLTADNTYTGGTTIAAGTLQLGTGGTTGSLLGNVTNNGTLAFNRSNTVNFTGAISGAGNVVQQGAGTTILTADNTYGGETHVTSGALYVNGNQSAATGLTTVAGGATLGGRGIIGGDVTLANGATLAPGDVGTAPGTLTINGNLSLSSGSTLTYSFGQANVVGGPLNDLTRVQGDLVLDGTIDVVTPPGGAFDPGVYRVIDYSGALTDNGLTVGAVPSPSVVQTSIAHQVNLVNTNGLTLNFWDGAAGPKNDGTVNGGNGVWQSSAGNDNWTTTAGTLNASFSDAAFGIFSAAPGTVTVDNSLGAVRASGMQFASSGYVIQGDDIALTGLQSTIRVGDASAAGAGYTAVIASRLTGDTQLVKSDLGALVLTGNNTYTGGTQVTGGSLYVNGNQSAATGLTSVASGATLGGAGTIGGSVTFANGATLAPGSLGPAPGALTIGGNLSLSGGSTLAYSFGQANVVGGPLNDLTRVQGDLVLDGTINVVTPPGGSFDPGVYRVIDYSGTLTDNGLTVGAVPSPSVVQTSVAHQVNLVNAGGLTLSFWDGAAGPKNDGTVNGGNGMWQSSAGNNNWTNAAGAINAPFADASFAVFSAAPGTVTVDNSLGAVRASGMQFASSGYVIQGDDVTLVGPQSTIRVGDGTIDGAANTATIAGRLIGNSQLVKSDLGTLVLTGSNTYTGGTTIAGGTLQLGAGGTTGSLLGDVTNNGTLALNRSDTLTFTGAVSGTGGVSQIGTGTTTLSGRNSYSGLTHVIGGTLAAGAANVFSPNSVHAVDASGTLDLRGFDQTIAGLDNAGTVLLSSGTPSTTLTVNGRYIGRNGVFGLTTFLGADDSPTDRLVIDGGTAAGSTTLHITNADRTGSGALTIANGIPIVSAVNGATTAPDAFQLDAELRAGFYTYALLRGGLGDSDAQSWFLRSHFTVSGPNPAPAPPEDVLPEDPAPPVLPPGTYPILGPEIATYAAVQPVARQLGLGLAGTLHERSGDTLAASNISDDELQSSSAAWGRIIGQSVDSSFYSFTAPRARGSMYGFQAGVDVWRGARAQGHRDAVGAYFGHGTTDLTVEGLVTNADATDYVRADTGVFDLTANAGGAYWTHYGHSGWYLDGAFQGTRYDGTATTTNATLPLQGIGIISSLEAGFPLLHVSGFQLEPQGQLLYQHVAFDADDDGLGAVALGSTSGVTTRFGARARWTVGGGRLVWQPYGTANVWQNWGGRATTIFSDTGQAPLTDRTMWLELVAGTTLKLNTALSLYGQASHQFAVAPDDVRRNDSKGNLGLRVTW